MVWEYKTIKLATEGSFFVGRAANIEKIDAALNSLGADGWELVAALDTTEGSGVSVDVVIILKRPGSKTLA